MKITVTVKEVNPEFDPEIAANFHDGQESEDNVKYNWEDEFEVKGDCTDLKIRNNAVYKLEGFKGEEKFAYDIESMTILDCIGTDGTVTNFAASRKLIKDTKKNIDKKGDVHFFMFIKGGHKMVNPVPGIYISESDFPFELPVPDEDEITHDADPASQDEEE